jgi:cyanophycinase
MVPRDWFYLPLEYDAAFRDRYATIFRKRGVTNIRFLHTMSRQEADTDSFAAPIASATGVWMVGGRQWLLADVYVGTRTESALWNLLDRGGVIGGYSASAAIQGSYLVRGDPRGNASITSDHERGFGFLKNTAIDIHVLSWNRQFDLVPVIKMRPELLGLGIDADAAIVVHGDEFRVIGVGHVAIYDPKLILANGKFYFLDWGERFNLASRTPMLADGRPLSLLRFLPRYPAASDKLTTIAGTYRFDNLTISVFTRDDRVFAELAPGDERELVPVDEDGFVDSITGSKVTFRRDENGYATTLQWEWSRCRMVALRTADAR